MNQYLKNLHHHAIHNVLDGSFNQGQGYSQGGNWGNQNPWDDNGGGNWSNQGYGDQGNWGSFGSGYQQSYSGGPVRPNYNTQRQQPYNSGKCKTLITPQYLLYTIYIK